MQEQYIFIHDAILEVLNVVIPKLMPIPSAELLRKWPCDAQTNLNEFEKQFNIRNVH